jgi:hypothetical protein
MNDSVRLPPCPLLLGFETRSASARRTEADCVADHLDAFDPLAFGRERREVSEALFEDLPGKDWVHLALKAPDLDVSYTSNQVKGALAHLVAAAANDLVGWARSRDDVGRARRVDIGF